MSNAGWHARPSLGRGRSYARLGRLAAIGLLCMLSTACATGLQLRLLAAASAPPRNVALFFSAHDAHGEPITGLRATDFRVFEDGDLVPVDETRQVLADPGLVAERYLLLLMDMSGSVVASDQLAAVIAAADAFIRRVAAYQHVAVFAFDGAKALYEILSFGQGGAQAAEATARLQRFESRDPATNLNGAVLQGLSELDRAQRHGHALLRFGTLVVLTDGSDHANRISYRQMIDAVDATAHRVYAVGVGRELDDSVLSRIGKTGYIRVEDSAASPAAFRELGADIVRAAHSYYLLSYCSRASAGAHTGAVEARAAGRSGRLAYTFDAAGFGARCDPTHPPTLDAAVGPSGTIRNMRGRP